MNLSPLPFFYPLQHPNIGNMTDAFSWKAMTLQPFGVNNTAIFFGIPDYNTVLLPAGQGGNVQSEFLFAKRDDFTLDDGWGFPRVRSVPAGMI